MPERERIETCQRQKRVLLLQTLTGTFVLLVSLNLRFIPSVNDRLSGPSTCVGLPTCLREALQPRSATSFLSLSSETRKTLARP